MPGSSSREQGEGTLANASLRLFARSRRRREREGRGSFAVNVGCAREENQREQAEPLWQDINILTRISLVALVGLAAKNAILIVEFARDIELEGHKRLDTVIEACRLRLRPILMMSFAFILGVLPLVVSSGSGSEMGQAIGVAVFFGMLGVTLFGLIFTPMFYIVVRNLADGGRPEKGKEEALAS